MSDYDVILTVACASSASVNRYQVDLVRTCPHPPSSRWRYGDTRVDRGSREERRVANQDYNLRLGHQVDRESGKSIRGH